MIKAILFHRKRGWERYWFLYRETYFIMRMFVEVDIEEEDYKWIKKWAKRKRIMMPRAYGELLLEGIKHKKLIE